MKVLRIILGCFLVLVITNQWAFAKNLRIGTLSPLTGAYAQDGNDILQGVKTAVMEAEDKGLLPEFTKIEVVPGDSACDGGKATMAANKLIHDKVNVVIGAFCSSATIPASVPLNQANIIQITPASTNEQVTERGLKWIFRILSRDDAQAWSTVRFFEKCLKIKTLALIDDRQTYTVGLTNNITKMINESGKIKIVAHEHITPGDKDFMAVLTKLKQVNADAIYLGVYQPEGSLMTRQIKLIGLKSILMGEDALYHPKFIEVGGDATEGIYLTFANPPETPERENFEKLYKELWKEEKVGSYAYYAYDATKVYLEAVKKSGSTETEKVAETIRGGQWKGSTGEITFDAKGDRLLTHIIWLIKNGSFIRYWDPMKDKYF